MPTLTSLHGKNSAPEPTIKIVRDANGCEWSVIENGSHLCKLGEMGRKPFRWMLTSTRENWEITETARHSAFLARSQSNPTYTAEIEITVPNDETADALRHFYIDRQIYRALIVGNGWKVYDHFHHLVYHYNRPWRDSDTAARVCYNIWPTENLTDAHRDLLLVLPLFWTGMACR